ncbi:MAG: M48 family metalloprotease [Betaproteobacteria bacterium]
MAGPLVLLVVVLAAACATNPATGERQFNLMSEAQEVQIGQQQDVEVRKEMGVYADQQLQQYVSSVGLKLAQVSERPALPWHFTIVDVPAINAFALPGGYIYITRGIMAYLDDEAQLAGVLGHEIGHVTARHAAQQYSRATGAGLGLLLGSIFVPQARPLTQLGETGLGLLFLKYGRDDEAQADGLGVRYAARAGWDPEGVPQMLRTLGRIDQQSDDKGVPNWLATHPPPENRIERVQAAVQQAERASRTFTADRADYLRRIDGIIYGDDPAQGIVRGSTFLHPNLRFAVDFPGGWTVQNGQTQVVANAPKQDALMLLQVASRPQGGSLESAAVESMNRAGLREVSGGASTINGLSAFVGTFEGTLQGLGQVGLRGAFVSHGDNVFLVAGIAPVNGFAQVEPTFSQSLRTFRPLSSAEAQNVHPSRVDLYTARSGDTWQSIAQRPGRGIVKPETLAIMNGHDVNVQPRDGERLKIVVAG